MKSSWPSLKRRRIQYFFEKYKIPCFTLYFSTANFFKLNYLLYYFCCLGGDYTHFFHIEDRWTELIKREIYTDTFEPTCQLRQNCWFHILRGNVWCMMWNFTGTQYNKFTINWLFIGILINYSVLAVTPFRLFLILIFTK